MNVEALAGCYVAGHWGQYAVARSVEVAVTFGYNDTEVIELAQRKLASSLDRSNPGEFSDDDEERLYWASDEVERWMNENAAPEGYSWGWHDGEFFLESNEWWEES